MDSEVGAFNTGSRRFKIENAPLAFSNIKDDPIFKDKLTPQEANGYDKYRKKNLLEFLMDTAKVKKKTAGAGASSIIWKVK